MCILINILFELILMNINNQLLIIIYININNIISIYIINDYFLRTSYLFNISISLLLFSLIIFINIFINISNLF